MALQHLARALVVSSGALFAFITAANAVVIRDDVEDAAYQIDSTEFPALADLPHEGHGVLIAPQWVITAAHAVSWQSEVPEVCINGVSRRIERIIIHPGYRQPSQELITYTVQTGDPTQLMALLASSDDIALIRLAQPVTDIAPAVIHRDGAENGRMVKIIGRGATGVGSTGHNPHGPNRTQLRRAFNQVSNAEGRWLNYVFDTGAAALPLEGMSGNGDSGGPVLVDIDGRWELAGLASWKYSDEEGAMYRPASYGQTSYNIRVSHYTEWIESVMAAN